MGEGVELPMIGLAVEVVLIPEVGLGDADERAVEVGVEVDDVRNSGVGLGDGLGVGVGGGAAAV